MSTCETHHFSFVALRNRGRIVGNDSFRSAAWVSQVLNPSYALIQWALVARLGAVDLGQLERSKARLGDAVLGPPQWISVVEDICSATGTSDAGMLQSDVRCTVGLFSHHDVEFLPGTPSGAVEGLDPEIV